MELKVLHLTEDELYVVQSAKSIWLKTEKGFMKTIYGPHTATYNVKDCFYGNLEDSAVLMDCYENQQIFLLIILWKMMSTNVLLIFSGLLFNRPSGGIGI